MELLDLGQAAATCFESDGAAVWVMVLDAVLGCHDRLERLWDAIEVLRGPGGTGYVVCWRTFLPLGLLLDRPFRHHLGL